MRPVARPCVWLEILAQTLNRDLEKVAVHGRKGIVGQRRDEEIAILSIRAGDLTGDHTVRLVASANAWKSSIAPKAVTPSVAVPCAPHAGLSSKSLDSMICRTCWD